MKTNRVKQVGVALITVMLVVALAAMLATQMAARLQMQIQRTSNLESNQQALWYALGTEAFAKRLLIQSFKNTKDYANLTQLWAEDEKTFPVELGEISGKIVDLHSCINLNAVGPKQTSQNAQQNTQNQQKLSNAGEALMRLLPLLDLEGVDEFAAEAMADSLADWIDSNASIISSSGAEDDDYASKEFAYYAANSFIASVNELRVVEHYNPTVINKLRDYVCVIPGSGEHKININTLDAEKPELLQALLGEKATLEIAENILSARGNSGFKSVEDFLAINELKQLTDFNNYKDQFVVDSEYFKLTAKTSFNESYVVLNSVMKINEENQVTIMSRKLGAEL